MKQLLNITYSVMWWYFSSPSINLSAIYRITAVLKAETDIIVSIAACPTGQDMLLVIMYVKIFKTCVIVFINEVKMCLRSH